jgi:predicted ATPase/class 3 adenylate cyclase
MTEEEKLKRHIAGLEDQGDTLGEDAVLAPAKALPLRSANLNAAESTTSRREHGEMRSQFVGRKAEFQVIKRRIESLTEGNGRIISLVGVAGMGKSRLIVELRNHVCRPNANFPLQWLEASAAVSMGNVASYGLFRQIIGRYAGIAEQDDEDQAWHKLQSRLGSLFGDRSTEILPHFATMMALHESDECVEQVRHLSGETISSEIFRATEQLLESISSKQPLALVLEDVHCIDESSAALLQHLLPLIYRAPILILGIGRPTVETPHSKLHEVMATVYHNRYDEIRLAPLSPHESAQLATILIDDDSHSLALTDKVLQKAKGNPFLIEQAIESLIHVDYDNPRSYIPERLAEKILATGSTIEGERKFVTVKVAGVEGFSSLSDMLSPEEVQRIMNGCYRILMDEVHECEGTVTEFRSDGVVAVFGAPLASEDHAQRACYACVAIHKALVPFSKNLKKRFGIDFKVRIGLNTGPVVVGPIGENLRMDFTAQGDTTNIAFAMEGLAGPGTVLVSEQTYRFAKNFFEFEPLGQFITKRQEHAVQAYRLMDKACAATARPEREVYSAMIGRDQELLKLELQALKAASGESSVVNVIGDAGIGKSRLVAELKKRKVAEGMRLLEGRAISIGKNLSFHPIIDLLRNWAQIREDDSEMVAAGKLEAAVLSVCPDQAEEVFPFVATLMGMKLLGRPADRVRGIVGEPLEKLIFKNVRELLIRLTNISPTIVVMEDLHWADASSLLLLDFIYRLALTQKIVFINVFRPGYWDTDDGTVEKLEARIPTLQVLRVLIPPLDPQSSEALIDGILNIKGLQHGIKEQIIERTGGNPYFIEEMVRSLIVEGAVKAGESGFEVTDKIHSVVIPSTINEALMARISKLDEESRNIVRVASVIGRSFFHRILADVMTGVNGLDDNLVYLKQIQLIREQIRMGELEYSFQHALAQEAVYQSILLEQQKELHVKVAESIERVFSERIHEFYGTLAYHYGNAGNPEKTEECLIKAGEEALKSAASSEALHYYQGALAIYRKLRGLKCDPAKVAVLERNIALAVFNRGHYTQAVEHFDKALVSYWGELPKNSFSRVFRFLWGLMIFLLSLYFPFLCFRRDPTQPDIEAIELIRKKVQALAIIDIKRFFIECLFYYPTLAKFDFTKFQFGIGFFAGASSMFTFTGLSFSIGRKILNYAKPRLRLEDAKQCIRYDVADTQHHFLKGEWNEIAEYNEDLVNRLLRIGEVWDAADHYYWHGLPKVFQGHFDTAKLMVSKLSEIAETYENDVCYLLKYMLNILLLVQCRNIDEANAELDQGFNLAQRKGLLFLFSMHSQKVSVQLLMRETDGAGKSLEQADRLRSEVKLPPGQLSVFYRNQFEYYLRLLEDSLRSGHKLESSEHRRNAIKSGKMLMKACRKAATYRTDSCRLMGVYKWLTQDRKSAFKWWQKAIREGERLGARPQLARTYAEMAVRSREIKGESLKPFVSEAEGYLQKARTMFSDLGLHHDLEDLNSAISRKSFGPFGV